MLLLIAIVLALPLAQAAQTPLIGIIEVYGNRRVPDQAILTALQLHEGDPIPDDLDAIRRRLAAVPGVAETRVSGICCDEGRAFLSVGVREVGQAGLAFRPEPTGPDRLPREITDAGDTFDKALQDAVVRGAVEEDQTQGHALTKDPAVRAVQEQFVVFARRYFTRLRHVLRDSASADDRALAAQVVAYTTRKADIVPDLVRAARDPSPGVRNNAVRALALIALLEERNPSLGIYVPAAPFVDLLTSIEWTDRNKASLALLQLTASRRPDVLDAIRSRALIELVEMARSRSTGHAYAPFMVLGRTVGLSDDAINTAWERGNRAVVLDRAQRMTR